MWYILNENIYTSLGMFTFDFHQFCLYFVRIHKAFFISDYMRGSFFQVAESGN